MVLLLFANYGKTRTGILLPTFIDQVLLLLPFWFVETMDRDSLFHCHQSLVHINPHVYSFSSLSLLDLRNVLFSIGTALS
jgi:hypothetical protein